MKYLVKKGDTLWDIWKRMYKNKYSWSDFQKKFLELNPGKAPSMIEAGEYINLPDANTLIKIASENPTLYSLGSFALGGLFIVGILWLTKKLKI